MIVGHHDLDAPLLLVHHHLGDLGGCQRVHYEGRGVLRPRDDVDLLALQLRHDSLDAAPAHADARAHGIDAAVVGDDGDLRAASRVTRDCTDLDDAVVDLRDFLGEELRHVLRMGARQEDLRTPHFLAHVVDIGAHALPLTEGLARQELVAAQDRLGATQIDDHVAELDALHQAVHDLADAVLVLRVLALTLGVAHLLHDHLLGGLRGDAAEIDRRQRIRDEVADLGLRIEPARLDERNLRRLVLHGILHLAEAHQADLAVLAIDLGADVVLLAVLRASRLLDRLFHRDQHLVAIDALVARDGVRDLQQLGSGVNGGGLHGLFSVRVVDVDVSI